MSAALVTYYQSWQSPVNSLAVRSVLLSLFRIGINLGDCSHVYEISMHHWVHLTEHYVCAYKKTSASCCLSLFLEAKPELFSGNRSHSSDRTMDLGLAEDHFSRPVVSNALLTAYHAIVILNVLTQRASPSPSLSVNTCYHRVPLWHRTLNSWNWP